MHLLRNALRAEIKCQHTAVQYRSAVQGTSVLDNAVQCGILVASHQVFCSAVILQYCSRGQRDFGCSPPSLEREVWNVTDRMLLCHSEVYTVCSFCNFKVPAVLGQCIVCHSAVQMSTAHSSCTFKVQAVFGQCSEVYTVHSFCTFKVPHLIGQCTVFALSKFQTSLASAMSALCTWHALQLSALQGFWNRTPFENIALTGLSAVWPVPLLSTNILYTFHRWMYNSYNFAVLSLRWDIWLQYPAGWYHHP